MTIEIKISDMTCQHCVSAVTKAITAVPGVKTVTVDLRTGLARVNGEPDANQLIAAIAVAGYGAELV